LETGGWVSPKRDVLNTGRTSNPRSTPHHNLPAQRSSFVGRKREMLEVRQALAITRLLTLTGAGGSGKTRLALEVARGLIEAYPDGAWLVELAPLSEEVLVPKVVAEALEVPERPAEPLADTLVEVLRDRQLLLVLDNCEHLLKAIALLVDKLLDSCPRVRILATSREALGVEGEARRPVPPLSVPEPQGRPSSEDSSSSVGLEGYESVRLFIERARERDPAFSLSPQNAPAVAEICGRLEGIPLAIELAAARVGTLSLAQISERLVGSLELLTRGGRTAVPRQRTLKGTLDWSYDLLSESEQTLFNRLSVFAGGWTLEAASMVAPGEGIEDAEVLDLLSGLVEKSLVMTRADDPGGARYRLLEPVRQYALDKLEESDEAEEVRRRHALFFLGLAEETETEMRGPEQAAWLDRLEADHDNLRGALSWALERGEPELGLHLAEAFWWFWESRGYFVEGRWWLEQALARGSRASSARAKALDGVGWLAFNVGDVERAVAAAEEGLKLRAQAEIEPSTAASLLRILALKAEMRGDYERATELFRESLDLGRETEDKLTMVWSVIQLGLVASDQGDHERATQLYEEGLALCLESGYTIPLPDFLSGLGYEFMLQGDQERATTLIEEATTLVRRLGQRRRPGGPVKGPLERLGWASLLLGDQERAKTWYEEHLRLSQGLGNKLIAAESLEGLACAVGPKGEAERAAKLFGAAQGLREAVGYQKTPNERTVQEPYLVAARSRLDEAAWEAAFAEGRSMTLEEAVEYALSEEEPFTATLSSSRPEHPAGLTSREIEVLGLVAAGMTSAQIAKELFLSPRTVEAHLVSIYHKLGVTSRAGATRFALEHGLA
jgi:predicted ATPase/DNA-binding CsgD family transcriptional regulator